MTSDARGPVPDDDDDVARRRDEAVRRAMSMPPVPRKAKGKQGDASARTDRKRRAEAPRSPSQKKPD
jgi:hypothetical protein